MLTPKQTVNVLTQTSVHHGHMLLMIKCVFGVRRLNYLKSSLKYYSKSAYIQA